MREFAKYNGDVLECLKGLQREKLGGDVSVIDKFTRKRKWIEAQEAEAKASGDMNDAESSKATKTARIMATPKKAGPSHIPGTAGKSRLKTPGAARTIQRIPSRAPSPSPHKPPANKPVPFPRIESRPPSPVKPSSPAKPTQTRTAMTRVPSSSSFNPSMPAGHPRWPRKDENMLSVNGSPLANPYQLGLGFPSWMTNSQEGNTNDGTKGHKRTNSIIVRTASNNGLHSRSNSQSSIAPPSQPSQPGTNGFVPVRKHSATSSQPDHQPSEGSDSAALPGPAALVSVLTKDGHILEFDPFHTSPEEIDGLEGISDSAKKQAKEDISRMVMQAVERWKLA